MSRRLNTPGTRKTLTNMSVVKLKKAGRRFELACYPVKVAEWKKGLETNIEEVIQTDQIFQNVQRGIGAKKPDLKRAFPRKSNEEIIAIILSEGEIQESEEERKETYEKLLKDIATIIVDKCVSPDGEPLTRGMIERAMKQIHYGANPKKSAKQQALQVIKLFQRENVIPIERAKMRIQLSIPAASLDETMQKLEEDIHEVEQTTQEEGKSIVLCLIEPNRYRIVNNAVKDVSGSLEVIVHSVKPLAEEFESMNFYGDQ
eukprot:TRINITY_DN8247_c0_g1_i1.p1 TRINITY_DN8247_c0_g1~~TRINITY_DN8247_c0_g1_i1.p1  ORF type:complete len:273 (+),score=63.04 TRINITY_DN8247_c0_g1_i1:45-821(+)